MKLKAGLSQYYTNVFGTKIETEEELAKVSAIYEIKKQAQLKLVVCGNLNHEKLQVQVLPGVFQCLVCRSTGRLPLDPGELSKSLTQYGKFYAKPAVRKVHHLGKPGMGTVTGTSVGGKPTIQQVTAQAEPKLDWMDDELFEQQGSEPGVGNT